MPQKTCTMSGGNLMKPIRHSLPFPHMRWPRGGEGVVSPGVYLGYEDALQEGLWGIYLTGSRAWQPFS